MRPIPGFVPFSQNKFLGLFQDSEIHTNPCSPKISTLILLTVCHTFLISHLSLTNFQHFPGPVALFQDFPDLKNATVKFQDFPGFPGPIRTLQYPAILTRKAWSIKDLLFGFWGNFSHGTQRVDLSRQDSTILPTRVANHSIRFGSSCPLTELAT